MDNLITVVIPTLGGQSLGPTIDKLNSGSVLPSEILVCIPEKERPLLGGFLGENVRIVATPCRGQVAQRAFGFNLAQFEYVLQLDDDMFVDEFCLERLVETIQLLGPSVSVAPVLIDDQSKVSVYHRSNKTAFLSTAYFWLMNGAKGYRPGFIDKAGSGVGVDPEDIKLRLASVEWLPGGCIMHRKPNLILEDFWGRPGKAYYEDVLHSSILTQNGVKLFLDTAAKCSLEVWEPTAMSFCAYMRDFYQDFLARKFYMTRTVKSSGRIYIYYFIRFISHVRKRLKSMCSNYL